MLVPNFFSHASSKLFFINPRPNNFVDMKISSLNLSGRRILRPTALRKKRTARTSFCCLIDELAESGDPPVGLVLAEQTLRPLFLHQQDVGRRLPLALAHAHVDLRRIFQDSSFDGFRHPQIECRTTPRLLRPTTAAVAVITPQHNNQAPPLISPKSPADLPDRKPP